MGSIPTPSAHQYKKKGDEEGHVEGWLSPVEGTRLETGRSGDPRPMGSNPIPSVRRGGRVWLKAPVSKTGCPVTPGTGVQISLSPLEQHAGVAKLGNAHASEACGFGLGGSTPLTGT